MLHSLQATQNLKLQQQLRRWVEAAKRPRDGKVKVPVDRQAASLRRKETALQQLSQQQCVLEQGIDSCSGVLLLTFCSAGGETPSLLQILYADSLWPFPAAPSASNISQHFPLCEGAFS